MPLPRLLGRPAAVPYLIALAPLAFALATACSQGPEEHAATRPADAAAPPLPSDAAPPPPTDAAAPEAAADAAAPDAAAPEGDPMANHKETKEDLLALFSIVRPPKRDSNADGFLDKSFGTDGPSRINQGNKELARHFISKEQCLKGLEGITLQTDEQRAICGAENMVPIYKKGKKPKACIDVFEFPNKPCELPMVWAAPVQAQVICELQGKRLCAQEEWVLACRGDPEGGKDRMYAYGDEQDMTICNTNKPAKVYGPGCEPDSARSAWKSCATNTEPAGAFPQCRSRFGVFDQHGNVAEIMNRRDRDDGKLYDQLKGSAFFYVDVARKPNEKGKEKYPDHCAHDPRWHVEPMNQAWHSNYHLGFRCCKTVR